jgi:hypothetical protein
VETNRTFDAALASGVSDYDGMVHADLAQAYNEMGLSSDALREGRYRPRSEDTRESRSDAHGGVGVALGARAEARRDPELKSRLSVAPHLH